MARSLLLTPRGDREFEDPEGPDLRPRRVKTMRDHFMTAAALLAAVLLAAPLSAGAADPKADSKTESKMDQVKDKAKDTAQEAKGVVSDSWLTSKAKIALFADERVKG